MIETPEERRARRLASYGDTHAAHGHALPDVQVGLQDANDVEACCGRTVPHAKRDDVGTALEARHRMCQLSAQHRKHRGGHGVTVAGSPDAPLRTDWRGVVMPDAAHGVLTWPRAGRRGSG